MIRLILRSSKIGMFGEFLIINSLGAYFFDSGTIFRMNSLSSRLFGLWICNLVEILGRQGWSLVL